MGDLRNLDAAFGIQLRTARQAAGMSQEQLAFSTGLHRTYISLLERGRRSPTLDTLFRLCKALELDPAQLIAALSSSLAEESDADNAATSS